MEKISGQSLTPQAGYEFRMTAIAVATSYSMTMGPFCNLL
jgi:hypothetical protein